MLRLNALKTTRKYLQRSIWILCSQGRGLKEKDVERAIELARVKYCPAWSMLKDVVEITHSYQIRESE